MTSVENVDPARNGGAARRALRMEIACARALLDELEATLDAEEDVRCDVSAQAADQLTRLANTMKSTPPAAEGDGGHRTDRALLARMQNELQLTFRNMAHSYPLSAHVTARAEKLQHFFDRIVFCRVVLGLEGHHQHRGDRFAVSINLGLPKHEILVNHMPSHDHEGETAYAAVDRAFSDAERQLEHWIGQQRGGRHADNRRL
jgi:ribosome-associated translation inhibitor RaiA